MKLSQILTEEDWQIHNEPVNLWEMSNLYSQDTGITSVTLWLGSGTGKQHGPNVKVSYGTKWNPNKNSTIPLYGQKKIIGNANISQSQFDEIQRWINLNKKTIMQYWNNEISTAGMISQIKKLI